MTKLLRRKLFIALILTFVLAAILVWQTAIVEIISLARFDAHTEIPFIALSFDDGPDLGEEELLKALNNARIHVTFFWTLEKIQSMQESYPEEFKNLVKLINQGGHEIGIHGYQCHLSWNPIERFFILNEDENIEYLKNQYHDIFNTEPKLYRSHGPRSGRSLYSSLKESDVELAFGSVQYQIGVQGDVKKYIDYTSEAEAGKIICGHDSRNCELDSGMPENITDIIPEIKQIISEREISIVTISELFETQ